ncbi:hypothetical protein [Butyrivibrio sp. JL13D10]|uniref:hypothetical protein n=1 Tax=Butyrivibrio sp. JL13D10 TaxID=3236815 RepID=UPI0038B51E94
MKKSLGFLLAGILLCSTIVLSGFANKNNANSGGDKNLTASGEVTQEQIEENIIGTWFLAEQDGQPALTNEKRILDIISTKKAYSSVSRVEPEVSPFDHHAEAEVDINGNIMTITIDIGEDTTPVHEFTITDISDNEFTAIMSLPKPKNDPKPENIKNDSKPENTKNVVTFVKIDDNYTKDIIGTWEGRCTSKDSIFDDEQDHRWEYKADGTFVYYVKDGDKWIASEDSQNEYFVEGPLLCTRWVEDDVESREWWEITIDGDKMNWTALREDENGKTFTATFEMNKVDESSDKVTQEQIEENIIGRWMLSEEDGTPVMTNEKSVFNIVSTNKAYAGVSWVSDTGKKSLWHSPEEVEVTVDGNVVTITINPSENRSFVHEFTINDISDSKFTANKKRIDTINGAEPSVIESVVSFVKINDDYSKDIIGTWEGRCTSEGSAFDDGQDHRWEYKDDGTFVYYVKDGDEWAPGEDSMNEYFVDGNLLCTRWMEGDEENREWWETTIDGDKMSWTALREDENGKAFTATFEMTRVTE